MDRGTYTAASSGYYHLRRMDVVNNNLANSTTPGYKRQLLVGETQDFDQTLARFVEPQDPYARGDHERAKGVVNIKTVTDFSLGPIKNTGNALDVAIREPNQFFVVNTASGPQYTRAGNFTLNSEGEIITLDGQPVQGDGGNITANGPGLVISQAGVVKANNERVGKLQIVQFDDPSNLERVGSSRFAMRPGHKPPIPVEDPILEPKALEMSNVSVVTSMMDLIKATRGFQMYAKTAKSIDEINQAAITRIGRRQ